MYSWLTSRRRPGFDRSSARSARPRFPRLTLEALENRLVPSISSVVSSGLNLPHGVAVDPSGNVYIADTFNNAIEEFVPSSNTVTTLVATGLNNPSGVAVDASGNVYIANTFNNTIEELVRSSNTLTTLVSSGLNNPYGVAVDASGNVYIADAGNNAIKEWVKSSNSVTTLVSSGLTGPYGVAVDAGGNVYIADAGNNAIEEWVQSSNTVTTLVSSGLNGPEGVAVDVRGNVYIADTFNDAVEEWVRASNTVAVLVPSGLTVPTGVAVDGNNNVYIANSFSNEIAMFVAEISITTQPVSATATVGQSDSVSFTVAVSDGTPPLSYQWQSSTDNGASFSNLSDGDGVAGATTSTLTLSDFSSVGSPKFQVVVTDANTLTVTSEAATLTINPVPTISGTVFHDYNTNGVQDSGEPGLAGQTVFVDLDNSGVWQPGDPTAFTDINGAYQIQVPNPGTYTVRQVLLGGVLQSAPASGSYQATITNGVNVTGQDFADVLTSIAVPLTLPPSVPFQAQGSANADYVEAVYRAVLDRNADSGGLANWTNLLNTGTLSRLQVVQGIRNSPEHFAQEVTDFYLTLLNRAPDTAGLQTWVQHLESGMREEQMAFYFLDSPEYLSEGDKHFVDAMYQSLLGRSFDAAGEANWLSQLGDDTSGNALQPPTLTHEQVITFFLYSTESETRLTEGYYEVFLQRPADAAGLNGWVGALQQGVPFLTIGQQFLASDEFYNRAAEQG
jgi:DNA-binding beta-propeller fold protein YncE